MADRPSDLKFTKTHEWVRIDGDTATVGITDFAVEHLGDLVFVDLPEAGRVLEAGEVCAEVESVKAVGEVMTPVGGEVLESNDDLADDQANLATAIRLTDDRRLEGYGGVGLDIVESAGAGVEDQVAAAEVDVGGGRRDITHVDVGRGYG